MANALREIPRSGRFLIVTWAGGGNVPPALGLGRRLAARGHLVRVLASRRMQERIEAAGCTFTPYPLDLEFDESKGRAVEDQRPFLRSLWCEWPVAQATLAEVDRDPADALLVDCYLSNALSAAERTGLPTAGLLHVRLRHLAETTNPALLGLDAANEVRARLGLQPLRSDGERLAVQLLRRCDRVLAVMPQEFEDFGATLPANVRYVGPVFEGDEGESTWDLPWPSDHPNPLVVVSFSTMYMHHEGPLGRVITALESLRLRTLLTLGGGLELDEVDVPAGVVVRRYVPHSVVFPHTALVVTHAGLGTIMAACTYGVPMVCIPLGRDQRGNAERVETLGLGRMISPEASVEEVRAAIVAALDSDAIRTAARRMAEVVAGYGGGRQAIAELESLLVSSRST